MGRVLGVTDWWSWGRRQTPVPEEAPPVPSLQDMSDLHSLPDHILTRSVPAKGHAPTP